MPIVIQNARILTPFLQQDGAVLITGDRIVDVSRSLDAPRGSRIIDAKNMYLVPGYIDLRVREGGGHSVAQATPQAITALAAAHALEGTTTVLPAVYPAPPEAMLAQLGAVREAAGNACKGTLAGVHLQGPFLSHLYASEAIRPHLAQPDEALWKPLLERWPEGLRIVGMSPELPGVHAFADDLRARGIVTSISHSDANYDQVLSALGHGFSDVSTMFDGSSSLRRVGPFQVPGVTESALMMDELTVQVNADTRQLPLMVLQLIFRCKGAENIMLVSGSSLAEASPPIAQLVRNMVAAGVSLRVALRMATVNPARRIGLDHKKGRIAQGYDADLLLLDETLNVLFSMAKGKILRNDLDAVQGA